MPVRPIIHDLIALRSPADALAVINQMDTSQAHLSSKSGTQTRDAAKPDNLSKDELTAVLKYGAQKMCVSFGLI